MMTKNAYWASLRLLVLIGVALIVKAAWAAESPPPIVHILAVDPAAAETGQDTATFVVYRTGASDEALTVNYTLSGSAVNGEDYDELSGSVTIGANRSAARITVTPVDDSLIEGAESVVVFLNQPAVWPPPYIVCWPSFAVGHIEDNDFPPVNHPPVVNLVNPPDGSVFEGPLDLSLVARAFDRDGRVRSVEFFDGTESLGIVYARPPIVRPIPIIEEPDDTILETDPLVFPSLELDRNLDVTVIPSTIFRLLWEDVPPGPHVLTAVATDNHGASTRSEPVRIRVTPPPPQPIVNIIATDPVATEPDSSGDRLDTATLTIGRTGSTDDPLTVFYRIGGSARNGEDYRELAHSTVIPAGAHRAEIVIAPLDDDLVEGPEDVVLALVPPPCIAIDPPSPDCYRVGRYRVAEALIRDNDRVPSNRPPRVEIVRPLDGTVFLAPADIGIVAQAYDGDGRVVTVEFFEGTNSLGVVTNNPSRLNVDTPAFSLKWPDVPPGRYVLTAKATDNDGAMSRSRPVRIAVVGQTDRPVVTIVSGDPIGAETSRGETPNPAGFTVMRTGPTDHPLVVAYSLVGSAENGVDYEELPGRVAIPEGSSAARILVHPIDDDEVEGFETVGLILERAPCIALAPDLFSCYRIGEPGRARAAILDNDTSPTNHPPKVAITNPQDGATFVAPVDIRLCAVAKDAEGPVKSVEFFSGTTSLGVVTNSLSAIGIDGVPVEQVFCLAWRDVPAGRHVLTAKATDARGAMSRSEPINIRVIEHQRLPVVTIKATDPFASEGNLFIEPVLQADGTISAVGRPIIDLPNIAVFQVSRDRRTNEALTVRYHLDGTASNGIDYRSLDGAVVIPAGAWSARIVVLPIDDRLVEGTETVVIGLAPVPCAREVDPTGEVNSLGGVIALPRDCYLVGDPGKALAYIRDNDFENRPPKVAITEPASGDVFPAGADIEIHAAVVDPDGYVREVEFFDGDTSIGKDTRVFVVAPPPGQPQRFSIIWSNAPSGRHALTAKATDNGGAMTRSEPVGISVLEPCRLPVVSIRAIDRFAREQNPLIDSLPDTATFRVHRTCNTLGDLKVSYEIAGTATNGEDYRRLGGTVVIPDGAEWADIVIDPLYDELPEGSETVVLSLVPVDCANTDPSIAGCYVIGRPARDIAYIFDEENRPPRVAIVRPHSGASFLAGGEIPIIAQALDIDGWVGRVEFFAGDDSIGVREVNFIVAPPPGQLQRFSMIWENAPVGVHVLTAKATDNLGAMTVSSPIRIEVVDSPPPPVVNILTLDPIAREGSPQNTATFRVRRSGPTTDSLTVRYAIRGTARNGEDYLLIPGWVTIPPGKRAARITITPIDDRRVEHLESVVLRLLPAAIYNVGRWQVAAALILDNDHPRPRTGLVPDELFNVRFDGENGKCYQIEFTTNFDKWEALDSNVLTEDGIHFVDPEYAEADARFYRVREVPKVEVFDEE